MPFRRQLFDRGHQGNIQRAIAAGATDEQLRAIADAAVRRGPTNDERQVATNSLAAWFQQGRQDADAKKMQEEALALERWKAQEAMRLQQARGTLDHQRASADHRLRQQSLAHQVQQDRSRLSLAQQAQGAQIRQGDERIGLQEQAQFDQVRQGDERLRQTLQGQEAQIRQGDERLDFQKQSHLDKLRQGDDQFSFQQQAHSDRMRQGDIQIDLQRQSQADRTRQADEGLGIRRQDQLEQFRQNDRQFDLSERRFGLDEQAAGMRMGDQERLDAQWQQQSAKVMASDVQELLKASRSIEFTPEGRRIYASLAAEGRALLGAAGKMRPTQHAEMLGQFLEKFEMADLPSYQREPPNIKDEWSRRYLSLGNGMAGVLQDGPKIDLLKDAQDQALKAGAEDSVVQSAREIGMQTWLGPKNSGQFKKDYAAAEQSIRNDWLSQNPDSLLTDAPRPQQEDVLREMQRTLEAQEAMGRFLQGGPEVDTMSPSGQDDPRAMDVLRGRGGVPMDPDTASRVFSQPGLGHPGPGQPEQQEAAILEQQQAVQQYMQQGIESLADRPEAAKIQQALSARGSDKTWMDLVTEDSVDAYTREESEDPFGDALKHAERMMALPDGFSMDDVPGDWQELISEELPTVLTKTEYDNLNPGDIFVDGATGKLVRKPVKRPEGDGVRRAYSPPPSHTKSYLFTSPGS